MGLWFDQLHATAPNGFIPQVGQGLVLGAVLIRWQYAPLESEAPVGSRLTVRNRAIRLTRGAILGFIEYPIVASFVLENAYECHDRTSFTEIEHALYDAVGWVSSLVADAPIQAYIHGCSFIRVAVDVR